MSCSIARTAGLGTDVVQTATISARWPVLKPEIHVVVESPIIAWVGNTWDIYHI